MPVLQQAQSALRTACRLACITLLLGSLAWAQANFNKMYEQAHSRYGKPTADMVLEWQTAIEKMKPLPDEQKLARANAFWNEQIRWVQDSEA